MPEFRDCGADAAAYALGALDPAEVDAFQEHLESCIVCAEELPAFQQVATLLSMGAPAHSPSRSLRRRVLRAVRENPGGAVAPASEPPPRLVPWWGSLPRPGLALGVLFMLVLVVGAGGRVLSWNRASSTRVIQASVVDSPGSAQLRASGDQAKLVVSDLSPPPAGLIYEVWLQRGHDAPSPTSALFSVTSNGAGDIDVPGDLHGVSQVTVTQEPADGSRGGFELVATVTGVALGVIQTNARLVGRCTGANQTERSCHMLGLDNPIHIAFILVLLLLVFGAKRLPEMGKSLGTGLRGFKESISGEHEPTAHLTATPSTAPMTVTQPVAAPVTTAPTPMHAEQVIAATPVTPVLSSEPVVVAEPVVVSEPVRGRVPVWRV